MLSYCLKCKKKNAYGKNPKVARTKRPRTIRFSKCTMCDSKKSNFIKHQEAIGLLGSLRMTTPVK